MSEVRDTRTRSNLASAIVCVALACSCAVENPSAFSEERFLCAPELASEWQAELERCRSAFERDRSCRGVVSFAGELQGTPVVVDAELDEAEFRDQLMADSSVRRDQFRFEATSPYFEVRLRFTSVGGSVLENSARELVISRVPTSDAALALDDALAHSALGLSASSQSVESPARAGALLIASQTPVEQSGSFNLGLQDGAIEGCFYMFTTTRVLMPVANGQE